MTNNSEKVIEIVASYWYKLNNSHHTPVEFIVYGRNTDVRSNHYNEYEVYCANGILFGTNLTHPFSFERFPSYYDVYQLIKESLESDNENNEHYA